MRSHIRSVPSSWPAAIRDPAGGDRGGADDYAISENADRRSGSDVPNPHRAVKRATSNMLPFLDTYRTMCRAPDRNFRRVLEDIRELALAA
jgi:hypothetical protein